MVSKKVTKKPSFIASDLVAAAVCGYFIFPVLSFSLGIASNSLGVFLFLPGLLLPVVMMVLGVTIYTQLVRVSRLARKQRLMYGYTPGRVNFLSSVSVVGMVLPVLWGAYSVYVIYF